MNKYPCELIEDLMPLYIEGDVSRETKEIVEEHVRGCDNCRKLQQVYSNDEFNIESFKDDLPQANTFKKWMKGLKVRTYIAASVLLIVVTAIGIIGYRAGKNSKTDILSLKTIVKAFNREGLHIEKNASVFPDAYEIEGIQPEIYRIGDTQDQLLIYVFESFAEREDAVRESDKYTNPYDFEHISYNAKNAFIVYMPFKLSQRNEKELEAFGEIRNLISEITFEDLNDGKEIVYKGESDSWQGTVTLKYYQHWWQDGEGANHYDSYHTITPYIKYKMTPTEDIGPISVEYETVGSAGKTTGATLEKDGHVRVGSGGGNGMMPGEDDTFDFTITWNGKEEKLILKAQ